jgi:hypothetical protein
MSGLQRKPWLGPNNVESGPLLRWEPTLELRWVRSPDGSLALQQAWRSSAGNSEWRRVPVADATAAPVVVSERTD